MAHASTHRGFSLLEVLIVLSVIGAAIVFVTRSADRTQRSAEVTATANDVLAYTDRVRQLATGMDYAGVTVANAVSVLDPPWIVNPATAVQRHGFGGQFTLAKIDVGGVPGAAFSFTAAQVPPAACPEFVRQIAPRMYRVVVGTTVVKNTPTDVVAMPAVRTACTAAAVATVRWELLL